MSALHIWRTCTGCILGVDLLLDIIAQYMERRALEGQGHDDVAMITSASGRDTTRKAIRCEKDKITREHAIRFMFIISLVIPAVVSWASPSGGFRGALAYFSSRFTLISVFCVENFVIVDTFRGMYDWQCFCMSAIYAVFGTLALHYRLAGQMQVSNALRVFLLIGQVLPVTSNTVLNVFIWIRMFLVRRKREAGANQWSCTVSEWTFLIYSLLSAAYTLLVVVVSGSAGFSLTASSAWDLTTREVVIIAFATATALLPARIARRRAVIAENTLTNAKRGVNDLLRMPLKVACAELDEVRRVSPSAVPTQLPSTLTPICLVLCNYPFRALCYHVLNAPRWFSISCPRVSFISFHYLPPSIRARYTTLTTTPMPMPMPTPCSALSCLALSYFVLPSPPWFSVLCSPLFVCSS